MHESFYRQGDYVLSKLKKVILNHIQEIDSELISVGNLNVNIDIGFASDYMKCVSSLICSCQSPKEVFIGTGVYTNLFDLFVSTLSEYGLSFSNCFDLNSSDQLPVYYPLVPFSLNNDLLLDDSSILGVKPTPLNATIIKYESLSFLQNA